MLSVDGDNAPTDLLDEPFVERGASVSADGRWLAYASDEMGRSEVFVRPFPNVDDGRWQVSTAGGEWPLWNPAADELFYRGPTGVMALAFEADPAFTPGDLTQLFERDIVGGFSRRMAVSSDGQRFLLLKRGGGAGPRRPSAERQHGGRDAPADPRCPQLVRGSEGAGAHGSVAGSSKNRPRRERSPRIYTPSSLSRDRNSYRNSPGTTRPDIVRLSAE